MAPETPFLIVGLGNPGPKYAHTRHNMGFLLVDALLRRWKGPAAGLKFQSEFFALPDVPGVYPGKVILLKPQTYMNLSGRAVQEAAGFFKIPPESRFLLVYDDLDLPPGQLRIRKSGSAGGHNGVKSVIGALGTDRFPRIRIGIGRSDRLPADAHALGQITRDEIPIYEEAIGTCTQAVETVLREGVDIAMNRFNQKFNQKREKATP